LVPPQINVKQVRRKLGMSQNLGLRRHHEAGAAEIGQVGLGVVAFLPDHQRIHLEQHGVFFEQVQKGGKQGGLAVVTGAERHEDGLLLRGAAERVPDGALEVLDHALGPVQFRFGGIRVVAHDAGDEAEEQRAFGLRIVVVMHQLGEVALGIMRQQHSGFEVEHAVQEI
jgi:hypothetical protein